MQQFGKRSNKELKFLVYEAAGGFTYMQQLAYIEWTSDI
jgi:hypothetical protein